MTKIIDQETKSIFYSRPPSLASKTWWWCRLTR